MTPPLLHIVAALPTPTLCADAEGRCVFVNDAWATLASTPPEACLGDGWTRIVHPRDRREVLTAWGRLVEREDPLWVRCRLQPTPRARTRWVRLSATRLPEGSGAALWVQCEDLTELHEARGALSLQVRTLELVDQLAPVGQWRLEGGRFWASERVHQLLGAEPGELDLEAWFDHHASGAQPAREQFEAALRHGATVDYCAALRAAGGRQPVRVLGRADYDLDGAVAALFGVVRLTEPDPERAPRAGLVGAVPRLGGAR